MKQSETEVGKVRLIMGICSQMGMLHTSQTPPHHCKGSAGQGFHLSGRVSSCKG